MMDFEGKEDILSELRCQEEQEAQMAMMQSIAMQIAEEEQTDMEPDINAEPS